MLTQCFHISQRCYVSTFEQLSGCHVRLYFVGWFPLDGLYLQGRAIFAFLLAFRCWTSLRVAMFTQTALHDSKVMDDSFLLKVYGNPRERVVSHITHVFSSMAYICTSRHQWLLPPPTNFVSTHAMHSEIYFLSFVETISAVALRLHPTQQNKSLAVISTAATFSSSGTLLRDLSSFQHIWMNKSLH